MVCHWLANSLSSGYIIYFSRSISSISGQFMSCPVAIVVGLFFVRPFARSNLSYGSCYKCLGFSLIFALHTWRANVILVIKLENTHLATFVWCFMYLFCNNSCVVSFLGTTLSPNLLLLKMVPFGYVKWEELKINTENESTYKSSVPFDLISCTHGCTFITNNCDIDMLKGKRGCMILFFWKQACRAYMLTHLIKLRVSLFYCVFDDFFLLNLTGLSLKSQDSGFNCIISNVWLYCSFVMEYDIHTLLDTATCLWSHSLDSFLILNCYDLWSITICECSIFSVSLSLSLPPPLRLSLSLLIPFPTAWHTDQHVCVSRLGRDKRGGSLEMTEARGRPEKWITTLLPCFSLPLPTRLRLALFP